MQHSTPSHLVSSGSKSRYFSLGRNQPFFVTLIQAIMAFKKMLKIGKSRRALIRLKKKRIGKKSFLQSEIERTRQNIQLARQGTSPIKTSKHVVGMQTNEMESNVNSRRRPRRRKGELFTIFDVVSKHVEEFHKSVVNTQLSLPEKLKRSLKVPTFEKKVETNVSKVAVWEPNSVDLGTNSRISPYLAQMSDDDVDVYEYLSGTSIYYGSTVALQARHGGFLSFHDAADIKASAHKILKQTKLVIINSSDLADSGAVRFGDAVWLQAGHHDVLGANYIFRVEEGKSLGHQRIRPALINCRRENIFKAQQYGRWIILNKDSPTETIGQFVLHKDNIMLEQEWYYLASQTPYDAEMFKLGGNFDDDKNVSHFYPGNHCHWKLHLIGLPGDESNEEKVRQKLLMSAQDQLDASLANRRNKVEVLTATLESTLPVKLRDENVIINSLPQKLSREGTEKHFAKLFARLSAKGFSNIDTSAHQLAQTYGKDSNIYKFKKKVSKLRQANQGLLVTQDEKVHVDEEIDWTSRERENYWKAAQKLLISVRLCLRSRRLFVFSLFRIPIESGCHFCCCVCFIFWRRPKPGRSCRRPWRCITTSTESKRYFLRFKRLSISYDSIDDTLQVWAATILQRAIRKRLNHKFGFSTAMR